MLRSSVGLVCRVARKFSVSMLHPSSSAIVLTTASAEPPRRLSERQMSSVKPYWASAPEQSKVSMPSPPVFDLTGDDFPSLGSSAAQGSRKSSTKGLGHRSPVQDPTHVPIRPQELQKRAEVENLPLEEATQERGGQISPNQNYQSVGHQDRHDPVNRQGGELGSHSSPWSGARPSGVWGGGHQNTPGRGAEGAEFGNGLQSVAKSGGQPSGPGRGSAPADPKSSINQIGHGSAEQVPIHLPIKPQELQQKAEVDSLPLEEASEEREGQTSPNLNEQSVQQDRRETVDRLDGELASESQRSAWGGAQQSGSGRGGQQSSQGTSGQGAESASGQHGGVWNGRHPGVQGRSGQGAESASGQHGGVWNGRHPGIQGRSGQQSSQAGGGPQSGQGRGGPHSSPGRGGPQSGRGRGGQQSGQGRGGPQSGQTRDVASGGFEFIDALGRTLTKILRHQAVEMKLEMSSDGYVRVQDLLSLSTRTRSHQALSSYTVNDVKLAVQQDQKQRLGIKEEDGLLLIRANQGHTIETVKSEHLLKPILVAEEVPICVHGTYRSVSDKILKEGLKRMTRNHIHFATGIVAGEGVISGMRSTCNVLIFLNVEKAIEDGMKLYISDNNVILTEGFDGIVAPKYFKEVLSFPDMKPLAPRSVPV